MVVCYGYYLKGVRVLSRQHCFPPVVDNSVRVLLLGSLPGKVSLLKRQYYGHIRNSFWQLMGDILAEPLVDMPYRQRLQTLLKHHVGLWDVIASAQRKGSLDTAIRQQQTNDLCGLVRQLPQLMGIAFNGATAAKIAYKQLLAQDFSCPTLSLPSSSPAYTLSYWQKLEAWRQLTYWLR